MFHLTQKYREETNTVENISAEQPTRVTRSKTDKKLAKPKFRLDVKKNSFNIRTIDNWNMLPIKIRQEKSITTFKTNVKSHLLTKQLNNL